MQDEIIRMAREAGWPIESGDELPDTGSMNLERFAALVAAHEREQVLANDDSLTLAYMVGSREGRLAEREACAKVCEEFGEWRDTSGTDCAAAIRARGNNASS